MNGGTPAAWALEWGNKAVLGTWRDFSTAVKSVFSPIDGARSARTKMKTLKQGEDLEDYIAKF